MNNGNKYRPGSNSNKPNNGNLNQGNNRPGNGGKPNNGNLNQGNNRPGNGGKPGNGNLNQGNNRPGNGGKPDNGNKPGNQYRPGANGQYPGGNANRPNIGNNLNGNKPGKYPPGHNPGKPSTVRPGMNMHRPPVAPPPPRPYHPQKWHYAGRPVPPPSWRPARPRVLFSTVLGLSFGTAINISIDYLANNGYTVDGYNNNTVYLNDVRQLGFLWPYASLYYNDYGRLSASEFVFSTPGYDMGRYNAAYNALVRSYGPPVSTSRSGGDITASWWGADNQFVTLRFGYGAPQSGPNRYFTTLTFGL